MKEFKITHEQREDVLEYMRSRNYMAARNTLNQLPELKDQKKEIKKNGTNTKKGEQN